MAQHTLGAVILREFCLAGCNKSHFLANPDALPALGRALASSDEQLRLHAASAILAFVYDNQKAKAAVKASAVKGQICLKPAQAGRLSAHAMLMASKLIFASENEKYIC